MAWTQGLLVGIYLCIQGVNWIYGRNLMEEWRTTRWHARARLHFLGKLQTYAGPNLLGGSEEIIVGMAQTLERLGMLKPPRATDMRISALGREIIPDGLKKGHMDSLIMCGLKGWHASGCALTSGGRAADAVVLGVQNGAGEWVAVAAATPLSPPKYLHKSRRMDGEFLALSAPQKRGEWEIDLPVGTFGNVERGVLRAWAMDFSRHTLYRLPGDQEFIVKKSAEEREKDIRF